MLYKNIFAFLFILISASVNAATLAAESDLRKFADKVMELAGKGDVVAAFDTMRPYVALSDSEFQSTALASKSQRDQIAPRFGKSIGYEFISSKKVGDSLIRLTYIEKTEKTAVPWFFYFYKTNAGWSLNAYLWSGQINSLFEQ
jgi:hypothetical protein